MKWVNGLANSAKNERKEKWHKRFALLPVVVDYIGEGINKRKVKVWLQYVWRKGFYDKYFDRWNWVYKEKDYNPKDDEI